MKKLFAIGIKVIRFLLGTGLIFLNILGLAVLFLGIVQVNKDMMLAGGLSLYVFNMPVIYLYILYLILDKPKYNPYLDINNDISTHYANYKYYGGKKSLSNFELWLHRLNWNEIERLDEAEMFLVDTINKGNKL
jgi:hypothetical protein